MTIYCADSVLGNNANTGVYDPAGATPDLKWVNAKQSLQSAWAAMSAGDTLYVRTGSLFSPLAGEGRVMVGYINKSNTTFEAIPRYQTDLTELYPWDWRKSDLYGADYDITYWRGAAWNGLVWDAPNIGGWTHVGDGGANGPVGTWIKSPGAPLTGAAALQHIMRVFRDSVLANAGQRITDMRIGAGLANAMSKAQLSAATPWYTPINLDADANLWMFTGSATVSPDQFFGGLAIMHKSASTAQTSGGSARGFVVRNATNVKVKKLAAFGCTDAGFGCSNPSSAPLVADILFEECYDIASGSRAFRNDFSITYPGSNVRYLNCGAISLVGPTEPLAVSTDDHRAAFEVFEVTDYASDVVIYNPLVIDPFHGGFSITAATDTPRPQRVRVIGGAVKWSGSNPDGHGFALTRSLDCSVTGVLFDGCPTSIHVGGVNARVAANKFIMRLLNKREPRESQCVLDIRTLQVSPPVNAMIEENTFDLTAMAAAYTHSAVSFCAEVYSLPANTATVRNNLFILGEGHASVTRQSSSGGACDPTQSVYGNRSCTPDGTLGEICVIRDPGAGIPILRRHVSWGDVGTIYPHTQASAASTWNINHGLNSSLVDVTVWNGGGTVVPNTSVTVVDANNISVTNLGGSISGTAQVVRGGFTGDTNNAKASVGVARIDGNGVPSLSSPFANILPSTGHRLGRGGKTRRVPLSTPGCNDPVLTKAVRQ
jgi:hypothetical protein